MKHTKKAFTLIELMVVIVIAFMASVMVAAPYLFYKKKQLVKNSISIVTQTLYETRNLAINGSQTGSGNTHFGLYFEKGKSEILVYKYPLTLAPSQYLDSSYNFKSIPLEPGVVLEDISTKNKALFIYQSISGDGSYFYYDSGTKQPLLSSPDLYLSLSISLLGSSSASLKKEIHYYTQTYISDTQ